MRNTPGFGHRQQPEYASDRGRRPFRQRGSLRLLWLFPLALVAAMVAGWFTWISPYGYTPPADLAAIAPDRDHRVFVYGTLRQPLVRRLVTGRWIDTREAILPGFVQRGLDLERQEGARTEGEAFTVGARSLGRLDRYERLGIRYERIPATLASGEQAWVYLRLPPD